MIDAILDILNSENRDWSFTDLKVKLSPHTEPIMISAVRRDSGEWFIEWMQWGIGYGIKLSEVNNKEVLATLLQRLKYLQYASGATNNKG